MPYREPSPVATHTYIFPADVVTQSVMDARVTSDSVYGPLMERSLLSQPSISIVAPHGIDAAAERGASIEFLVPDGGEPGFQIDAGVKYTGATSLAFAKKSMRMYFRSRYGAGKLKYPLFRNHPYGDQGVEEYDQLSLRNGWDSTMALGAGAKYIHALWIDDMHMAMGYVDLHGRPVHVYLNGIYWGHYHLRERPNEAYMSSYLGGADEDYNMKTETTPSAVWTAVVNAALAGDYAAVRSYVDEL